MIPWIQVYSNLIRHPKVTNLADELGLTSSHASPNAVAAGMLVSLWLWAAQNATDGDLSGCSDRAIAEAAEYKRKPAVLVAALIKTKWLDEDRKLHDWDEYASLLHEVESRNRQNVKERVKRYRDRQKQKSNGGETPDGNVTDGECNGYGNVTCNESNAPTLPNLTLPNLTVTNTNSYTPIVDHTVSIPEQEEVRHTEACSGSAYGWRGNVFLTQSEYDRLILDHGEMNVAIAINAMGKWLAEGGKTDKSHYALLRKELREDPAIRGEEP